MPRHIRRRELFFTDHKQVRRRLRIRGMSSGAYFRAVKFLNKLVEARTTGEMPDIETILWVNECSSMLQQQLHKAGLIDFLVLIRKQ